MKARHIEIFDLDDLADLDWLLDFLRERYGADVQEMRLIGPDVIGAEVVVNGVGMMLQVVEAWADWVRTYLLPNSITDQAFVEEIAAEAHREFKSRKT